jgi:hypothetical protein
MTQMWFGFWPSIAIVAEMNAQSTNAREKCHENKVAGVSLFHDNVIFHARISQPAPSVCD